MTDRQTQDRKVKAIFCQVSAAEHEAVRRAAFEHRVSMGRFVRDLIRREFGLKRERPASGN